MDIRVLILSPIRIYREGIADFLANRAGITRIDALAQLGDISKDIKQQAHNVVLVDMATDGACRVIRRIHQTTPDVSIVALAISEVDDDIAACAQAGATGFVTRDASLAELVRCIEAASRSELLCNGRVAEVLLRRDHTRADDPVKQAVTACLTKQESKILSHIRLGHSNKDIARALPFR